MKIFYPILTIFLAHVLALDGLQVPLTNKPSQKSLISPETELYIDTLLGRWNSSGLSVAVVHQDTTNSNGWHYEFGGYGVARADGSPVTLDTVFAIASNSKLFLALSVGLLIANETLAKERGESITWSTKARHLIPEWELMEKDMDRGVSIQDMLSHRTGMPRHDFSGIQRKGGVPEMISTLRYLKPSAEFRETFQYNNLMYETLSYLPQLLLNQSYESYIAEHLFKPLNMSASTYSVAEAEARGTMADGFQRSLRDPAHGINGTLIPTVPYFLRPGEEETWAGAGGVLTSAKDLATWASMLLNNGRHPVTNATIVPTEILDHVAQGLTVSEGKASHPELSPKVYGCGQWRYSYQGHEIVEHGGNNPGYRTQVARFPHDNLAIVTMSNDADGESIMEAVKWRIAEEILGLKKVNWNDRFEQLEADSMKKLQQWTPRPESPQPPSAPFISLAHRSFTHPTYGTLKPCFVSKNISALLPTCASLLQTSPVQRILGLSDLSVPTLIVPWKRMLATHLRLTHFSHNTFNATVIWTNAEVRAKEGLHKGDSPDQGDLVTGLEDNFEVEWVHGETEGLAFKGNFWGKEGLDSKAPGGSGKESAEVWFARD